MKYQYGVYWDRGDRVRNEDSILFVGADSVYPWSTKDGCYLAVICDGIGSMACGGEAAFYVTQAIEEWYLEECLPKLRKHCNSFAPFFMMGRNGWVSRSLRQALYRIHERLNAKGSREGKAYGTTVSILIVIGGRYLTAQLGDSCIYLCKKGQAFVPVTREDRNADGSLSKCIGCGRWQEVTFTAGFLDQGFLLTSDGYGEGPFDALLEAQNLDVTQVERRLATIGQRRVNGNMEQDNQSALLLYPL